MSFRNSIVGIVVLVAACCIYCRCDAQDVDMEFTLDVSSSTIPLPRIFSPNIDLSGRGFYGDLTWPQTLAASEVVNRWQKDIGFRGAYRIQYNLWEISSLNTNRQLQEKMLANYEAVIRKIHDGGGLVILDIFSTPQGQGKVLDKKSSPVDMRTFKALVKSYMRELSCVKKYNIWYEVWTAPDLDVFFLGRQQEYLQLYRAVAESARELEAETKIHIPVGGPATTWWFRNIDGNTAASPERSLIYELVKFCYRYRLPLDFVSWHAYSTDPKAEKEMTRYNKTSIALIRDWLSYFNFSKDTPLVIDEWNFDSGTNIIPERKEKSYVAASFLPARLRHMYEADLNSQVFFCLEDFQDNREGVQRNVGAFWYQQAETGYTGGIKAVYNLFQMLKMLSGNLYISPSKVNDEFVGVIATRQPAAPQEPAGQDAAVAVLIYNYIDPDIFRSAISRLIATLGDKERKGLLALARSGGFEKIKNRESDIAGLRASGKVKGLLKKALELHENARRFTQTPRQLKLGIKNIKQDYTYTRYTIDPSCGTNCEFYPREEKVVTPTDSLYSEKLALEPYSVHLILLKPKPPQPQQQLRETPGQEEPAPQVPPGAGTEAPANTAVTAPEKPLPETNSTAVAQ
ncbi:MAG: hypothetical protein PHT59_00070 [Candidatus Omnitrophica bacterium]|nr:hypothetical protein [Candidatus Omnitrophota bacterium]